MNNEEVERFVSIFEEKLYAIIKSAIEQTRGEVDIETLAQAIADQDMEATATALSIAYENMENQINQDIDEPLLFFFEAVAIVAATALGQAGFNLERTGLLTRDILRFQVAKDFAEFRREGIIRSVNSMRFDDVAPKEIAKFLVQNIGLSKRQQASLDVFRSTLERAKKRTSNYIPPGRMKKLNASQRSVLKSIMPGKITDEIIDQATAKQRRIMLNHRAQTNARYSANTAFNAAQQSAWERLDSKRQIDGYKRFWIHRDDERVRHTHRAVPGMNKDGRGLQEPFTTPVGKVHSPPLEINCRCRVELRRPQ